MNVSRKRTTLSSKPGQRLDRGDGKGFVRLTFDQYPDYLDSAPLPASGMSAIWTYRGMYRLGDDRVGQWSNETKITVTGN